MYSKAKERMMAISQYAGGRIDFVQGCGGNTSYKFDDNIMAIKASGYNLNDVGLGTGYVTVDYKKIKEEYVRLSQKSNVDVEKETLGINLDCIKLLDGMKNLRPSVEVGFHSYLQRAVVHTHSVYSNLLCCSEEGHQIADEIFGKSEFRNIYIPFISPGYTLSMRIKAEVDAFKAKNGNMPDIIFMESHGIIASNDDYNVAIDIHEEANQMIADYFKLGTYPDATIEKTADGFISTSEYIKSFIVDFGVDDGYFERVILYPDQMVYLGTNLGKTIIVDKDNDSIKYIAKEKNAQTLEELILGVAFIIEQIKRSNLTLKLLCDGGVQFIRNWESEKYRASLATE